MTTRRAKINLTVYADVPETTTVGNQLNLLTRLTVSGLGGDLIAIGNGDYLIGELEINAEAADATVTRYTPLELAALDVPRDEPF